MHTGEEWFIWSWPQYASFLVLLIAYLYLSGKDKLPSMDSFKRFADTINSAGGHIIILTCLTVYAIKITMQLFYHVMALPDDVLTKAQGIINMAATTCTGTLIGLPLGALLKTMTGGYNMPKGSDATSTATATQTVTPGTDPAGGILPVPVIPPLPPRV